MEFTVNATSSTGFGSTPCDSPSTPLGGVAVGGSWSAARAASLEWYAPHNPLPIGWFGSN
jgi:hypothetical protein